MIRARSLFARCLCLLLAAALLDVNVPALAFSADERERARGELGDVRRDLDVSRERIAELEAEIDAIGNDRASLMLELVETAAAVKAGEADLSRSEERLGRLAENETGLRDSLAERRGLLGEVLAAMQRLGGDPPPAVLVAPSDAVASIRAAMLMGAVLPEIRVEAQALASDLRSLVELKDDMRRERASQEREIARLAEEKERLTLLGEKKREAEAASARELTALRERAGELSRSAKSLEELVAGMDEELAEQEEARARASALAPNASAALRDPIRLAPARAFPESKGRLAMPASGVRIRDYGEADGYGGRAEGLSLATRSGAQITAPSDGWVVYAGEFRSYGKLLILNPGDGYHVVLAGMDDIDVELGQFVLAGEPVATMGGALLASATPMIPESDQPVLYVEFRKDGAAIDPGPWWADKREKVRG